MKRDKKVVQVGIVGAGLIGWKRAAAVKSVGGAALTAVADVDQARAKKLADACGAEAFSNWRDLVRKRDIDVVVISVPNKFTAQIAIEALKLDKHVLCEKPFGRNVKESLAILRAAGKRGRLIKVGFNHRFHPSLALAKKLFEDGAIGKLLFIRSWYGHGGRLGMEKEWRFQKEISGGGELLDQGVHVIDLARWFAGDFDEVYGVVESRFWRKGIEDNAFAIIKNKEATVFFHVSATNWKNVFLFEVFGDGGFLAIHGKGGSYGKETLIFGKRKPRFGVPAVKTFRFKGDASWAAEWKNFVSAIRGRGKIIGDGRDGLAVNRIVEAVYKSSREKKVVRL